MKPSEIKKSDHIATALIMVSFFLPMQVQVVSLILSCFYFVIKCAVQRQHISQKALLISLAAGSLYLLYLGAIPFTSPIHDEEIHRLWETRLALLLLPVLIGYLSFPYRKLLERYLPLFAVTAIGVATVGNIIYATRLFVLHNLPDPIDHVHYRIDIEAITGKHPTYMSMYLIFAICILLLQGSLLQKVIRHLLIYLGLICLLPLLAKSPLIALGLIFIHQAWLRRKVLSNYVWMITTSFALILLVVWKVPFISERMLEMFAKSSSTKNNVIDNSVLARKLIFRIDLETLQRYWLTGTGPARLREVLNTHFLFYSAYYGYDTGNYDPHNEYFYQWISFGIIGILCISGILLLHFSKAIRTKNILYTYLLLVLSITFFTESVLSTQHGILFYAFFTALFLFSPNPNNALKGR